MTPANLSQHATAPPRKPPLASKKKGGKEYSKDTSREIATTNTTLNAFVGGKQRSWMTNPGAPIIPSSVSSMQTMSRKRSAAGKQLESATSTAQQSRSNIPPSSGPGNTSTAVVRPPAQVNTAPNSATTDGIQVLPSPAPSEGRPSPTASSTSVQETVNLTDDAQTSRRANAPLQENPEVTRLIEENAGNQSTCSLQFMKPHARDFVENDAKRRKVENVTGVATAMHGSHPMPLTPVTSPGLRSRPVQDHNISNEPSSTARTSITTSIPIPPYLSGHSVDASWQPRASNVTSLQLFQPSGQVETAQQMNLGLPSQMHQQQQMNVQTTQHLPQQARLPPGNLQMVGRRTSIVQNPTSPTTPRPLSINGASMPFYSSSTGQNLQQLPPKASIMDFMTNIGGQQALRPAERVRIEWLCHALAGGDWGFITLHQLSCLSVNNKAFLELYNLIPADAYPGFDFLSRILSESHNLSPQFLDFFSNFPEPAQSLITKPLYQGIMRDLLPFLRKGALVFVDILNRCLYRQTSPAAGELVIPPFTCSVVLQRLLWRNIRIALDNGVETTSGAELEKKFIAQQFEILKSLGLVPPPQTAQDHQGWLAQQQHAQILANQQVIQNKYPELNRPLQTGVVYPPPQLSPTFQQRSTYQQVRSGGRLIPAPSVSSRQDVSHPQANQIINTGNSFVALQASVQGGQHTQHFQPGQVNQAQAVALPTSQSPSVVQSPLASTIHTPRLPGNFCQTSVAVRTPTESIGGSGMGNLIRSPPVMTPSSATGMVGRRPSVVSRVNSVDHYISVIGFATQDCSLPAELPCLSREFTVQQEMANRLSVWEPHPGMPGRSKRIVLDRSLIYRLRCVQAIEGKGDIRTESNWVLRETTWPAHLFVQLNNEAVMLRRKHIFNSDLYVDITNQVKAGLNVLKVAMIQDKTKLVPNGSYLLRVEILEARSYTGILNQIISKQVIDKEAAKAAIMDRLKPSEDDDVVVVKLNELTLSIVCPFTMTLIKTPVRGKLCLHTECFDLDNYLISRPRKKPREPPNADSWKCPYCSGDARPMELVVDGFVKELVTQVKDMKDAQDSKEVLIKVDGSWEFKKEETGKGKAPEKKQNAGDEPKKQMEVITIDDDD